MIYSAHKTQDEDKLMRNQRSDIYILESEIGSKKQEEKSKKKRKKKGGGGGQQTPIITAPSDGLLLDAARQTVITRNRKPEEHKSLFLKMPISMVQ